jgi:hypothetical protein
MFIDMKKFRFYFRNVCIALLGSVIFFAACKDEDPVDQKSNERLITSFVAGDSTWTINDDAGTIAVTFPVGTHKGDLVPTIVTSPKAEVDPKSGVAQNFFTEAGVIYTVTAEDGTKKTYTAKANVGTPPPSTACAIDSFKVDGVKWTITGDSITWEYDVEPTTLTSVPVVKASTGATVTTVPANIMVTLSTLFSDTVEYVVTAESGATHSYYAWATVKKSSEAELLSFVVEGVDVEWLIGELDENGVITITGNYPAPGADVTALVPTIVASPGAKVNPASGVAVDLSDPVTYTVTSEDGSNTVTYVVVANVPKASTRADWVVLARNGWHRWGGDGGCDQETWSGGNPMLALDNVPGSGWHSFADPITSELPQVLIIDLQETKTVSSVSGSGIYLNEVEVYVTDELPFDGYTSHVIDWNSSITEREAAYNEWEAQYNTLVDNEGEYSLVTSIPEYNESWGSAVATVTADWADATDILCFTIDQYYTFTAPLETSKDGRYVIVKILNSHVVGPWIGIFNIDIQYADK